jgi:hypothetical protein
MVDYEALYRTLFNGITDAIQELERQNYLAARVCLIHAQQTAEELFIAEGEDAPPETGDAS